MYHINDILWIHNLQEGNVMYGYGGIEQIQEYKQFNHEMNTSMVHLKFILALHHYIKSNPIYGISNVSKATRKNIPLNAIKLLVCLNIIVRISPKIPRYQTLVLYFVFDILWIFSSILNISTKHIVKFSATSLWSYYIYGSCNRL